jgi:hypothetical protein
MTWIEPTPGFTAITALRLVVPEGQLSVNLHYNRPNETNTYRRKYVFLLGCVGNVGGWAPCECAHHPKKSLRDTCGILGQAQHRPIGDNAWPLAGYRVLVCSAPDMSHISAVG